MKRLLFLAALLGAFVPAVARADDAALLVRPSVSVTNDTQNTTGVAVEAAKEDFLIYIFTITNAGTLPQYGYIQQADMSGVLPLVDVIDLGGAALVGNMMVFPSADIAPGASITRSVRVRVKYFLPPYSFVLKINHGNEARVTLRNAQAAVTAYAPPKTGAAAPVAAFGFGFAAVCAALLARARVRKALFG